LIRYRSIYFLVAFIPSLLRESARKGNFAPFVKNSDNQKGKSGGYRLIYYVKTSTGIILLTVYSKSEQSDIDANEIKKIIMEYKQ